MAAKSLAVLALLSLITLDQVYAAYNQVGNGLVRIELTKHYQAHQEIEDLEEDAEEDA